MTTAKSKPKITIHRSINPLRTFRQRCQSALHHPNSRNFNAAGWERSQLALAIANMPKKDKVAQLIAKGRHLVNKDNLMSIWAGIDLLQAASFRTEDVLRAKVLRDIEIAVDKYRSMAARQTG